MPLDLWVYQEILHELRPRFIVECGTAAGGSALFLASVCELLGVGEVVTVDIEERPGRPAHDRITYLRGSSVAEDVVGRVKGLVRDAAPVLVILDSDHSREHVLRELRLYGEIVTPGSYLIVEDTNVNGHPVSELHGPGPMEAVEQFLSEIPVNIDERNAATGRDVLKKKIPEERRFPRSGFSDAVYVLRSVLLLKTKATIAAPYIALADMRLFVL